MQRKAPFTPTPRHLWIAVVRIGLRLAVILAIAWAIHLMSGWIMQQTEMAKSGAALRMGMLAALLAAYAILIALPFVPGVELGISLMMIEGGSVAPYVYAATVVGLMLAYGAGRVTPYAALGQLFADLRLRQATRLIARLAPLTREDRLALLNTRLPKVLAPLATRHRYVLLAVLFNLPGTSVIGGGGCIALLAGLSGLYTWRATALTIVLAVAPVPIVVWIIS